MKRFVYLSLGFLVLTAGFAAAAGPLAVSLARRQLRTVFPESTVSLEEAHLWPLGQIRLSGFEIRRPGRYDVGIGTVRIRYGLYSLLKRRIGRVSVEDVSVRVDAPRERVSDMVRYVNLGGGRKSVFAVTALALRRARLDFRSREITVRADLSAELDPLRQTLASLDLNIPSCETQGFVLKDVALKVDQGSGEFSIGQIRRDELRIEDVRSPARMTANELVLDPLSARVLNGRLEGRAALTLVPAPSARAVVTFTGLDLGEVTRDLKLEEKFQMTGLLGGALTLEAHDGHFNVLNGDFATGPSGGVLVITNDDLLRNIARTSKVPLDIVVESFKNYHYNIGTIRLSLQEGDLAMDMAFSGETGKRNINVTLHDFSLTKGEP